MKDRTKYISSKEWFEGMNIVIPPRPKRRYQASKQLCPVCKGRGFVPAWFYLVDPDCESFAWNTTGGTETCRTCGGSGVI